MNKKYLTAFLSLSLILSPIFVSASQNSQKGNDKKIEVKSSLNINSHGAKQDNETENNKNSTSTSLNENMPKGFVNANYHAITNWFMRFFGKGTTTTTIIRLKISNVDQKSATSTAVVSWNTNQQTTGIVYFSTDSSLLASTTVASVAVDNTFNLNHSVTLSGLTPNTKYFYLIVSKDSSNNTAQTDVRSFQTKSLPTPDTTAPKILFLLDLNTAGTSSQIIWLTSEPSNGKIWISTSSPVNASSTPTQVSSLLSVFHNLTVFGLATSTKYFYVVSSTDASGNSVLSTEDSFTTKAN